MEPGDRLPSAIFVQDLTTAIYQVAQDTNDALWRTPFYIGDTDNTCSNALGATLGALFGSGGLFGGSDLGTSGPPTNSQVFHPSRSREVGSLFTTVFKVVPIFEGPLIDSPRLTLAGGPTDDKGNVRPALRKGWIHYSDALLLCVAFHTEPKLGDWLRFGVREAFNAVVRSATALGNGMSSAILTTAVDNIFGDSDLVRLMVLLGIDKFKT
jgi:hypothetical protein